MITKSYVEVGKSRETFVDVYEPVAGWKARLMVWDEECKCHIPWQTGFFAYPTKEEAIVDAKDWAEAEDVAYAE